MSRTDRKERTDEAMGEAIYAAVQSSKAKGETFDMGPPTEPWKDLKHRSKEIDALSKDEQDLLKELRLFFERHRDLTKEEKCKEVARTKEIIEQLQMNVNFSPFTYGETLLSESVYHSLEMVQLLIEKGADVNREDEMINECALDHILEEEDECDGELSWEKKAMKNLLLSNGAKTAEERWKDMAESIREG